MHLLVFFLFRILTAREKRVRQKFNSDIELQAYEKRLKDIEKKIRQLVKRGMCTWKYRLVLQKYSACSYHNNKNNRIRFRSKLNLYKNESRFIQSFV